MSGHCRDIPATHHAPEVLRPLAAVAPVTWDGGRIEPGGGSEAAACSCEALSAAND